MSNVLPWFGILLMSTGVGLGGLSHWPQSHPRRYDSVVPCTILAVPLRSCGVSPPHIPHTSLVPYVAHLRHTGHEWQTSFPTA